MKEGRYVFVSVLYVGFDAGEHSRGGDGSAKTSCKGYKWLLFTRHYPARCFRTFCAEIPSFSARNRIFLRFLCIAKRVAGHGVSSNYKFLVGIPLSKVDEESGGVGFCTEVFGRDMDERGRGPCGGFGGGHVGISQRGL